MSKIIRIATRKSPLALWQAEYVRQKLNTLYPEIRVELVPLITQGDIILDTPLAKIGGKGLFVKQLETALHENQADLAVHSMKDVPVEFPKGLGITTICQREDHRDVFVSERFNTLADVPQNGIIGTSSLRRQSQLKALRPDLIIKDLRGNVGTRLNKLENGEYDGILLAAAGLIRLGLPQRIKEYLSMEQSLSAVGQGAIGIETRLDDKALHQLLEPLEDNATRVCVEAERAMNAELQGGCQVPIAGNATLVGNILTLTGLVASLDGTTLLKVTQQADADNAIELGVAVAKQLLNKGADKILASIYQEK